MIRYELKYCFDEHMYDYIENVIIKNPAIFNEIYNTRQINNIYFDTLSFDDYNANLKGNDKRLKHRIRWYNNFLGYIEKPILEAKIKNGNVGYKETLVLPSFNFDYNFSYNNYIEILKANMYNGDLSYDNMISQLNLKTPVMINSYERKYYLSADGNFRLTLDKFIKYYSCTENGFYDEFGISDNKIILELKYETQFSNVVCNITNHFPFRVYKNSKYVNGIEALYHQSLSIKGGF